MVCLKVSHPATRIFLYGRTISLISESGFLSPTTIVPFLHKNYREHGFLPADLPWQLKLINIITEAAQGRICNVAEILWKAVKKSLAGRAGGTERFTRHEVHFSTQRRKKRSPKLVQTQPPLGVLQRVPRPAQQVGAGEQLQA